MFVETKEAGEVAEAPTKTLKPSEALRIGILETEAGFLYYSGNRTCALCATAVGAGYTRAMHNPGGRNPVMKHLNRVFPNVPNRIWDDLEWQYMNRTFSREGGADWLEGQGY